MRHTLILGVSSALMAVSIFALAQRSGLEVVPVTPGPGWKTCPRCEQCSRGGRSKKSGRRYPSL